ncbi:MAG: ANTAR domain-containing protein [Lachnospiraceae bacterium]|nr:ANTAR domain-containing protein [Lachnospiraceae bacterium]
MTSMIVVLPKLEDAKSIKNVLVKNGFSVSAVCTSGAQAISYADDLNDGVIVCSYKLPDMVFSELRECLDPGFELLVLANKHNISEADGKGVLFLSMPLKMFELVDTLSMIVEGMERRRRKARLKPKERNPEEEKLITKAKELLMDRNHMTEDEAHHYLQKCSMDSSTSLVETAKMVLTLMSSE